MANVTSGSTSVCLMLDLYLVTLTWLLSNHLRAAPVPELTADRLAKLGLMQRSPDGFATISDAGRNWLARNGHLRRS